MSDRIDLREVEYLALEGGGGKGTCYLGALKLLSRPWPQRPDSLLPLTAASRLKGISGASAGSIVAFMLAIGMNIEQIENEMRSKASYDPMRRDPFRTGGDTAVFDTFFENPQPGLMKSVYFAGRRNVSGWAVDRLTLTRSRELQRGNAAVKDLFPLVVAETKSANFYSNYAASYAAGRANQGSYTAAYPLTRVVLEQIQRAIPSSRLKSLAKTGIEGLWGKKALWADLAHCLLYDRGLLSGNAVREYARFLIQRYLKPSKFAGRSLPHPFTDVSFARRDPSELTFRELHAITGAKLVMMGTNITNRVSLPFSMMATPDFPVVDAVCLSMSIPGLFKPTFIAGEVTLGGDRGSNYLYKGFFVDGGMLVNIPIHAFDGEQDNPAPDSQHPRILGMGLADGVDRNERPGFQRADPLYQKYRQAKHHDEAMRLSPEEFAAMLQRERQNDQAVTEYLRRPDEVRNALPNMSPLDERRSFNLDPGGYSYTIHPTRRLLAPFKVVGDLFGQLAGTLTDFAPEAGQFRTAGDRKHYVPLDAYDISITDFTPDPSLTTFVNARSFNKLHWYFFNRPPQRELVQSQFAGVNPSLLPTYQGARSPTND
jgi:NTE family protein